MSWVHDDPSLDHVCHQGQSADLDRQWDDGASGGRPVTLAQIRVTHICGMVSAEG